MLKHKFRFGGNAFTHRTGRGSEGQVEPHAVAGSLQAVDQAQVDNIDAYLRIRDLAKGIAQFFDFNTHGFKMYLQYILNINHLELKSNIFYISYKWANPYSYISCVQGTRRSDVLCAFSTFGSMQTYWLDRRIAVGALTILFQQILKREAVEHVEVCRRG